MPDNHQAKKTKLIIAVGATSLVILGIWILTLPLSWPKKGEPFSWPKFDTAADSGFNSLKQGLDDLMSKVEEPEEATASDREIITNPQQLSEEEIKQIEEDIFPKEINAQKE